MISLNISLNIKAALTLSYVLICLSTNYTATHSNSTPICPILAGEMNDYCATPKDCTESCCRCDPYCPSPIHLFQCCTKCECCKVEIDRFENEIGYNKEGRPVAVGKDRDHIVAQLCCDCPGRNTVDNTCRCCCLIPFWSNIVSCFAINSTCSLLDLICYLPILNSYKKISNCLNCHKHSICCYHSPFTEFIHSDCCCEYYSSPNQNHSLTKCSLDLMHCSLFSCVQCLGGTCCPEEYLASRAYTEHRRLSEGNSSLNSYHKIIDESHIQYRHHYRTRLYVEDEVSKHAVPYIIIDNIRPPMIIRMENNN